tara:strand:+ start:6514 stop:7221 length:708 start_codon:yes stop_codon:yes gene_type:complete
MNTLPKMESINSCLVIGNSRWHWAFKTRKRWKFFDTSINQEILRALETPLLGWAAVGEIPEDILLDSSLEIGLKDIPLKKMPPWLGIDRALASWGAHKKAKELAKHHPNGLLVADAGSVFSLTKINAYGEFEGGQLCAGFNMQLKGMSTWTQNLVYPPNIKIPKETFPSHTSEAMIIGSLQALLGILRQAQVDAKAPIWLCGGDACLIFNYLKKENLEIFLYPNLALEAMIDLTN